MQPSFIVYSFKFLDRDKDIFTILQNICFALIKKGTQKKKRERMDIVERRFSKHNSLLICTRQLDLNNKRWHSNSSEVIDH